MNQIQSLNLMIDYITKYQNKAVYAHLFSNNLVQLLQKEVRCRTLFESKILSMPINFFEWPSLNEDTSKCYAPFNGSMFKLRYEYPKLFPSQHKRDEEKRNASMRQINKEDPNLDYSFDNDLNVKEGNGEIKALASKKRSTRSYKIGYYLNLLGSVH